MANPTINDWPENERPRERLIKHSSESLSDAQLLAIIIRAGGAGKSVLAPAMELLDKFGGLRDIDSTPILNLSLTRGLGKAIIAQLKAAFELGKRLMSKPTANNPVFSSSHLVCSYFAPRFKNAREETFIFAHSLMQRTEWSVRRRFLREHSPTSSSNHLRHLTRRSGTQLLQLSLSQPSQRRPCAEQG